MIDKLSRFTLVGVPYLNLERPGRRERSVLAQYLVLVQDMKVNSHPQGPVLLVVRHLPTEHVMGQFVRQEGISPPGHVNVDFQPVRKLLTGPRFLGGPGPYAPQGGHRYAVVAGYQSREGAGLLETDPMVPEQGPEVTGLPQVHRLALAVVGGTG